MTPRGNEPAMMVNNTITAAQRPIPFIKMETESPWTCRTWFFLLRAMSILNHGKMIMKARQAQSGEHFNDSPRLTCPA